MGRATLLGSGLTAALVHALAACRQVDAELACYAPELDPEEPEVREAPTPKRGHERFRMERRNLSMKMRSRR